MNESLNVNGVELVDKLLLAANTDAGRKEEGPVAKQVRRRKVEKMLRRMKKRGDLP